MPSWYRFADVVASVGWYEPFGLTSLEAMATGTPVVGYGVGGLLDTIVDQVTGSLVPPRDVAALAEALWQAIAEPRRRMHAVRHGGSGRIRESYDCEPLGDPLPGAGCQAAREAGQAHRHVRRDVPQPRDTALSFGLVTVGFRFRRE
jgi:hypothetical protein